MRSRDIRFRRKACIGIRRPRTYLIMARIPDLDIVSLIRTFPDLVPVRSGESHEPHVTLFGPFGLHHGNTPHRLLECVETSGIGISHIGLRVGDPMRLKGRKGVAITLCLEPAENLQALYAALVTRIPEESSWCTWIDQPPGHRIFHLSLRISIAKKDAPDAWLRMQNLTLQEIPGQEMGTGSGFHPEVCDIPLNLFRIAIVRSGALWKEFDLARGAWLSREEAYNPGLWLSTRREFRIREYLQQTRPAHTDGPARFVLSDLHLGHANIIRNCRRPFSSVLEMDTVLLDNWNYTVKPKDEVYYLGDLRHVRNAPPSSHFLERLHGKVTYITGNHDELLPFALPSLKISHHDLDFMLIHDPEEVPHDYEGWVIHGHLHNNALSRFPFINTGRKTINVSAELVNYTPINLDEIAGFVGIMQEGDKASTLTEARKKFGNKG